MWLTLSHQIFKSNVSIQQGNSKAKGIPKIALIYVGLFGHVSMKSLEYAQEQQGSADRIKEHVARYLLMQLFTALSNFMVFLEDCIKKCSSS